MQANQTGVVWTVIVSALILLIVGGFGYSSLNNSIPTAEEVAAQVTLPTIVIPTAAEIAALVQVPNLRNDNFDDILEGIYPDEVRALERQCLVDLQNEFEEDDVFDELERLVEDMEGEKIENLRVLDWNYNDDYDFDVINLGLNNEEDMAGGLSTTLRFSYELEDGNGDTIKDKAYLTASCDDFDDDDNEFEDLSFKVTL